jgi:hypothetical protein
MNGVLLRGLPFEDAERIVYLERLNSRTRLSEALPLGEFLRFREQQPSHPIYFRSNNTSRRLRE